MNTRVLVIDDFLKDPAAFQPTSRKLEWKLGDRGYYAALPPSLAVPAGVRLFRGAGVEVDWKESTFFGSLRVAPVDMLKGSYHFRCHFDGAWNGMVYLNADEDLAGGTGFFVHKRTGLDGVTDIAGIKRVLRRLRWTLDDLLECLRVDEKKPARWIETMRVAAKCNRAIAFDGLLFHSHVVDHRSRPKNPRITLNYFAPEKNIPRERHALYAYLFDRKAARRRKRA